DAPIKRHPTDRIRMSVREGGRDAVTHYRVLRRFRAHTHLSVELETGRTHQIRVHLAHIRYPLVGDPLYGRRLGPPRNASPQLQDVLHSFRRQALHAAKLGLTHPVTGEQLLWEVPPPADFQQLLAALEEDLSHGG
ncbi:MAG TPA: pseudouridine synthase, partial [Gammaproteobacteria bacterium]